MNPNNRLTLSASPSTQHAKKPRRFANFALRYRSLCGRTLRCNAGKELDAETGLYYYGARYMDPKTSRWLSGDPALGEYVPSAPVNEEAKKRNGSLPGMGGVFNYANLHVYHYAGNNPVKYTDPDGRTPKYAPAVNAFNLDFGRDYMDLAAANFREGEYGWAAMMVINATSEAAYNFFGAYLGASLIGAIVTTGVVGTTSTVAIGTQFDKLGTLVNNPNLSINWAKTTQHGLGRMAERGITSKMVESWMSQGKVLQQTSDKFMYISREGVAVVSKTGKLITAYTSKEFDAKLQNVVQQLFD